MFGYYCVTDNSGCADFSKWISTICAMSQLALRSPLPHIQCFWGFVLTSLQGGTACLCPGTLGVLPKHNSLSKQSTLCAWSCEALAIPQYVGMIRFASEVTPDPSCPCSAYPKAQCYHCVWRLCLHHFAIQTPAWGKTSQIKPIFFWGPWNCGKKRLTALQCGCSVPSTTAPMVAVSMREEKISMLLQRFLPNLSVRTI